MPDPTQLDSSQADSSQEPSSPGRWLVRLPDAARVDHLTGLNADLIGRRARRGRLWLTAVRFAVMFGIGVAVTLAWQPYGDAARIMIANASPQLGWLAPQPVRGLAVAAVPAPPPRAPAASADLSAVRDRIDRLATNQEQITRSVALLTASQAKIAQDIAKVREMEQYLLYKTSYRSDEAPHPRPVTASAHKQQRRPLLSAAR